MRLMKGRRFWRLCLAMATVGSLMATPAWAADMAVAMQDDMFVPSSITVQVGDRVTWTNRGARTHTATGENGMWDSGSVGPGGSFSAQFNQPGTFPYVCRFHADRGMRGTIVVMGAGAGTSPATSMASQALSGPPAGHANTPRHRIEDAVPAGNTGAASAARPATAAATGATLAATAPSTSGPPRGANYQREAEILLASPEIAPQLWLEIFFPTPVYGLNGEAMGSAQPGDEYRVVLEDRDWALVRKDDAQNAPLVWIALGRSVGYQRP
jgi:plastocyanin